MFLQLEQAIFWNSLMQSQPTLLLGFNVAPRLFFIKSIPMVQYSINTHIFDVKFSRLANSDIKNAINQLDFL